jgi:hypothetical protein
MIISKVAKEQLTDQFLESLHKATFDYSKEAKDFKIDGGYIGHLDDGTFVGYVLYKELSDTEVELMYGGADKSFRGFSTLKNHMKFIDFMMEKYESIMTSVWNKNHPMLKIYMALEFDVIGTKLSTDGNKNVFVILNRKRA